MIYPKSEIFGTLTRTKNPDSHKKALFWACFGIASALGIFALLPFLKLNMPKAIARIIVYGGLIGIFQIPFRKVIIKEEERMEEFLGRDSESFNKYLGIRNIDTLDFIDVRGYSVPVFEMLDGTHRVYMELRVGASDPQIARTTRRVFTEVFQLLGTDMFSISFWVQREIFSETLEGEHLLNNINAIQDSRIRPTIAKIYQNMMDISDEFGNIPVYVLGINTTANFQKMELEGVLNRVLDEFDSARTNIRRVRFLDGDEVLEVTKEYLDMSGIDPSKNIVAELLEKDLETDTGVFRVRKDGRTVRYDDQMEIKHSSRQIN